MVRDDDRDPARGRPGRGICQARLIGRAESAGGIGGEGGGGREGDVGRIAVDHVPGPAGFHDLLEVTDGELGAGQNRGGGQDLLLREMGRAVAAEGHIEAAFGVVAAEAVVAVAVEVEEERGADQRIVLFVEAFAEAIVCFLVVVLRDKVLFGPRDQRPGIAFELKEKVHQVRVAVVEPEPLRPVSNGQGEGATTAEGLDEAFDRQAEMGQEVWDQAALAARPLEEGYGAPASGGGPHLSIPCGHGREIRQGSPETCGSRFGF